MRHRQTNYLSQTKQQGKVALWVLVVFFSAIVLALSALGLSYYQKQQDQRINQIQNSALEDLRQAILKQDDVINTNWFRTLNPIVKKVQGNLLWSSAEQQGIIDLFNLVKLKNNQQYHLWIYDLEDKNSAPISALVFKPSTHKLSLSFKAASKVVSPFKFELILEEDGVSGGQSLLLAQP